MKCRFLSSFLYQLYISLFIYMHMVNLEYLLFQTMFLIKITTPKLMISLTTPQHRVIFLYEHKLCRSGADALRNINRAFSNDVVDARTIQKWFQRFRK